MRKRSAFSSQLSAESLLLGIIIAGYLIVAGLYALYTPAWQTPDEPAHYNYVAQVAANGCCPQIEPGDWNAAYQDQLKAAHFRPDLLGDLATIQYEDHQPPLYYLLASLVFKLTGGSLAALRLFSALIGLIVVVSAYGIGKVMLPERPQVALGAAALAAFLPQQVALLASVNNDGLGWSLVGVTLLALVVYLKRSAVSGQPMASGWLRFIRRDVGTPALREKSSGQPIGLIAHRSSLIPFFLGFLVGLCFITKAGTYFLAGLVPLAILLKWWIVRRNNRTQHAASLQWLVRDLALFLLPALILGGLWWARNLSVYGAPDFLGLRAHDLVVADQPRTADRIAEVGLGAYLRESLQTTFNSFWGQFGWMALPLPEWMYAAFMGLLAVSGVGLVLDRTVLRRLEPPRRQEHQEAVSRQPSAVSQGLLDSSSSLIPRHSSLAAWLILCLTLLLAILQYLYYNTEFLQLQGRYMFTGLIPFALWLAVGVDAWARLATRWLSGRLVERPYRMVRWLAALAFLPLALLDVYVLWRFIVPLLSP